MVDVSLDTSSNQTPQMGFINLDEGTKTDSVPSLPVAKTIAAKASYGLSNTTGHSEDDIFSNVMQGQEGSFRQEAASAADFQKSLQKQRFINTVAQQYPDAASLARDKFVMSKITGLPEPTDPNSVIEEYLSGNYLKSIFDFTDSHTATTEMPEAVRDDPQGTQTTLDTASSILAYKQYAVTRTQRAQELLNNQSTTGYVADYLKGFSQIYNELKLRGYGARGLDWTSLLGDALDHERQDLWNLDFPAYKQRFDSIMDGLEKDNPQLAVLFGQAVIGQSRREVENNNALTLLGVPSDLSVVGGIGKRMLFSGSEKAGLSIADKALPGMTQAPSEFKTFTAFRKAARTAGINDKQLSTYGFDGSISFTKITNPNFVRQAAQDVINSTDKIDLKGNLTTQDIKAVSAAGRGDFKESAVQSLTKELYDKIKSTLGRDVDGEKEAIPSYLVSDADTVGAGGADEIGNRVIEQTVASQVRLEDVVNNMIRVQRTPALIAAEDVSRLGVESVFRKYAGPNSTVLGVEKDPTKWEWHPASNRYMVPIYQGTHDGESFRKLTQAKSHMKMYNIPGSAIKQEGLGYVIRSLVPLPEGADVFRDMQLEMPGAWSGSARVAPRAGTKVPYLIDPLTGEASTRTWDVIQGYFNSLGGKLPWRSPTEVLSPEEQAQREVATFGPTKLMEIFQDNNKLIQQGNTKEFKQTLIHNQTAPDPDRPGEQGIFFKNIGELQVHYDTNFHRMPTDKEIQGYFAVKNNYEMERVLRTLTMLSNKSRRGFMGYRIYKTAKDTGKSRTLNYSDWFDARPLDDLPRTNEPVYVNLDDKQYVKKANSLTKEEKEGIDQGKYKVLELWNREDRSLHGYDLNIRSDTEPRYVITSAFEYGQLDFNKQVPRRGGGHWIFDYPYYLKQADIYHDPITDTHNYRGDITLMPFALRTLGEDVTKHFNNIRDLIRESTEDAARQYVNRIGVAGLDFDRDILPMFKPTKGANGQTIPPRFNLNEDFRLIHKDTTMLDIDNKIEKKYGSKFVDFTRNGNMARSAQVEFTGKRDAYNLHTIEDRGSARNPIYQYRPAKLMDPLDSLNRGMSRIANTMFMDDAKDMFVNHWIENARPWLNVSKEDLRHSPFYWFNRAEFKSGAPASVKSLLEGNRKLIQGFLGTPSKFASISNVVTSELMNSLYRGGVKADYIPLNRIPFISNPIQAIRGLVFDMKLGLGSLPAFFTQITAFSNVMAINFKQAPVAAMAVMLHDWSKWVQPAVLDELDRRATNLSIPGFSRYLPGELKEAINLSKKTGFFHVGSEHAMVDSMLMDRGVMTRWDTVRYWGRTAFREGAQSVRKAAFFAAHKEFRDKFPTKALTRADEAWIINRASLLDHNMSRAANSSINSGIFSVPAQFYTYARNLSEMFYGKRLTPAEKLRLFGINSVLWGIPAGGIGLFGLPAGDWVNQEAIKKGYIPGNSVVSTTLIDGLTAAVGAYITGDGDIQKGTVYDFSKFGVKGWDPISNITAEDKTFLDFLGGASFSTMKDTWNRSSNLWKDMGDLIHGTGGFKLTGEDVADLFKSFSGFSYAWRVKAAMNTGMWMSNNNTPLDEVTGWKDALFRGITGTVPTDISNITATKAILKERLNDRQQATNQFQRNFNLALIARRQGDEAGYRAFMTKANAWLTADTTDPNQRAKMISEVLRRKETLVRSLNWSLSHQNVPAKDEATMRQREIDLERLKQKREGE